MTRALLVLALLSAPAACLAQSGGDFDLSWSKISAGGTVATGGSFTLAGTLAQIDAASRATSADPALFRLYGGLWHPRSVDLLVSAPDPIAPIATDRFDLEGFRENPVTSGNRTVSFSLSASAPVRLDVLDVSGRIVLTRSWDVLGPGPHQVDLGSELRVQSGVYWLRLTQGSQQMNRKVVVLD